MHTAHRLGLLALLNDPAPWRAPQGMADDVRGPDALRGVDEVVHLLRLRRPVPRQQVDLGDSGKGRTERFGAVQVADDDLGPQGLERSRLRVVAHQHANVDTRRAERRNQSRAGVAGRSRDEDDRRRISRP